jgi:molecular chaperone DnaK (HSP70)
VGRSEISQVLLVGGATWVPAVRNAVIDHMGRPAVAGCDPDLAVSLGACVSAAIGAGYISPEKGLVVQDVSTYGLGTLMVTDIGGRRVLAYDELMPPNTPVPFTTTCGGYHLQRLDQDAMHVSLVQDITPDGSAVRPDETHCITEGELVGIPPSRTSEPHEVELQFSYDTNGIVVLTASLPSLEKQLTLQHQLRAGTSTPSASLDRVDELWDQAPLAQKHATWVRRAEEHLATDPPNAEALSTALVSLKTHISMNDATQAEEARGRLIELLADA